MYERSMCIVHIMHYALNAFNTTIKVYFSFRDL